MRRFQRLIGATLSAAAVVSGGVGFSVPRAAGSQADVQAGRTPVAQTYKGLTIAATAVTRSRNVSLGDCPPGANTQRGVIRPTDDQEFVTVTIEVAVLPSFAPVELKKPTLVDAAGHSYNTGQTFARLGSPPSYACDLSFRVPTGTAVSRLVIEEVSFDLRALGK